MKRSGIKKFFALIMVLSLASATVFGANVSHVSALSNGEKAKELVSKMTLEEKIGQKLMLSFRSGWTMKDGKKIASVQNINDEIYQLIGQYDIGSVILFAVNFDTDATINVELTNGLQQAAMDKSLGKNNIPLLIGTDQEGGIVYRLTGGTALPGNMALGATNNLDDAKKAGTIIGSELHAVGINTNFAPVADVNNNANNPVIGLRSFSSNPQLAAKFTTAYIDGVHSQKVATTAKHFPGHGNVSTDSHTGLPSVPATKEELYKTELVPFQAAIKDGTDLIMTAHIQFPNFVKEKIYSEKKQESITPPATLSREILTDLLRGELNFNGVIVTDSMTMGGIANYFDVNERNLLAIKAGVDILDIPFTDISSWKDMESKLVPLINAFVDAYTKEDGYNGIKLSMDELDKSVERILTLKYNRGIMDLANDKTTLAQKKAIASKVVGSVENRETERLISAHAVTVVKNENDLLPLKLTKDSRVLFAHTYSRNNNRVVMAWNRAKAAGIIPEGADYKILQHYNWTGLNDNVNSALNSDGTSFEGTNKDLLDWCNILIHASEVSSSTQMEYDSYLTACPKLFTDYCKDNGKQTVIISLNQPYDTQLYPSADAILAVFGTNGLGLDITESYGGGTVSATAAFSPNLTAGVEVALGTFGASGKLPVDIPKFINWQDGKHVNTYSTTENVYKLGYGITYDSIVKDPNKNALKDTIELVKNLNTAVFTNESVTAATKPLKELQTLLKSAENTYITHKLAQSVVDKSETDLRNKYNEVLALLIYNTNKSALTDLVEKVEKLDQEYYTTQSWEVLAKALDNAKTILKANVKQEDIDKAYKQLEDAQSQLVEKVNRQELRIAIDTAHKVTQEQLDKVIPAVVTELKTALDNAQKVYDNKKATQVEVNDAFDKLSHAMSQLDFYKGNKTALKGLVNQIDKLNRDDYFAVMWKVLDPTLTKAKTVLANENALEKDVNDAYDGLVKAFLQLQMKPSKDLLNEYIAKAEKLDQKAYTNTSWKTFEAALTQAKAVVANSEASQKEVTEAQTNLSTAMNHLVSVAHTSSTQTEDTNQIAFFVFIGLLALTGGIVLKKKKFFK